MFVHLLVGADDAKRLFDENEKLFPRERCADDPAGFDAHFHRYMQEYMSTLDCSMEFERHTGLYSLRFGEYLPEVPQKLTERGTKIVGAELVRYQSAPIKARAGFYRWPQRDATATVERIFPAQSEDYRKPVPLYAQNITVKGKSLADVLEFNSKLSQGAFSRFLVTPWE